jgi:hypothetical protein
LKQSTAIKMGSRFLLYVGIALGVLIACALFVLIAVYTGHTRELPIGWFGLAGFTPLIFWAVIKSLRKYWNCPTFWVAVLALLIVHLLAFVAVLLHYPRWPLLWFIPVSFVEAGVFLMILGKLFNDKRSPL